MRAILSLVIALACLSPTLGDELRYYDNPKLLECLVGRAAAQIWTGESANAAFASVREDCLSETALPANELIGRDSVGPEPALRAAQAMIDTIGDLAKTEGFY